MIQRIGGNTACLPEIHGDAQYCHKISRETFYYFKNWSVDMDLNTQAIKSKAKMSVVLQLFTAVCGVFVAVFGLWMFNQHLLMSFSLPLRMVLLIITQWLLFLVPGILMIVNQENFGDIGFRKEKVPMQIGIGVLLAFSID